MPFALSYKTLRKFFGDVMCYVKSAVRSEAL